MSTDQPGRQQKVVMVLGIAAIILFSANLFSAVLQHFWPNSSPPEQNHVMVELAPHRPHRIVIRHRNRASATPDIKFDIDLELKHEMQRLEADIASEMAEFEKELSFELERGRWQHSLEAAKETLEKVEISMKQTQLERLSEDVSSN